MTWKVIETLGGIEAIQNTSYSKPHVIFKHSTRCGISAMALNRLEEDLVELSKVFDLHYLDLLNYREVSDKVAEIFGVRHASPQVIIIYKGESVYDVSHGAISSKLLLERKKQLIDVN